MKTIRIIIEKTSDFYDAYAENCEGICGSGETAAEAKDEALKGLALFIETQKTENLPSTLKGEYKIEFKFDVQSLLKYYSGILTNAALERLTGINQKQLWDYANGLSKPRESQIRKIETALHKLGNELTSISL